VWWVGRLGQQERDQGFVEGEGLGGAWDGEARAEEDLCGVLCGVGGRRGWIDGWMRSDAYRLGPFGLDVFCCGVRACARACVCAREKGEG
jgi:hypothetical protein